MEGRNVKLSFKEKAGYSLGDAAANFIFQTIIVFQLAFYTDTFGLTAAAAGTLFLMVRVSDAITDPIMGIIADRFDSRWGKFRPWVLWSAVPFGIMAVLTFTTPDFDYTGKLIWAYVTYGTLMIFYTINNLPYSALSAVMTGDPDERTSLSSYRFVAAMLAAMAIQGLALPLVEFFGQGDDAVGYRMTMIMFGSIAVVFFVITFLTTKERIKPEPNQKSTVLQDLKDVAKPGPWLALIILVLIIFIFLSMRGSVMYFYFQYYLELDDFARDFSIFNVFGILVLIIGIMLARKVTERYGKRNVFLVCLVITTILTLAYYLIPPSGLVAVYVVEFFRNLAYGFTVPLLWAMMPDVADYSEWKTHRRATGMVYAGMFFVLKAGLGIGGAIAGWVLDLYGYVPNAEQTAAAKNGIVMLVSVWPSVLFLIGCVCLWYYRIDRKMELQIAEDLADRRSLEAASISV